MNNKADVLVMGLGYVGLPTAALLASNGVNVCGVDTNTTIVDIINAGKIHIIEPELDAIVATAVYNGKLIASTTPTQADTYIIVVPTPFKGNHEPDISYVEQATRQISPLLKEGDLYLLESTSPVGTTEKMRAIIHKERPDLIGKVHIAYCPERVLPGNIIEELKQNDRVIGGLTKEATEKAISFYSTHVNGELHKTNARTAEMCKLVENSSRDVQIAFANELSLICDKADIDVWELINLANKHPRVNILKPGCGVGGHCIAVDPYFLLNGYPIESQIIRKAREINNYKAIWSAEKIISTKLKFELEHHRKPTVALMGLAFKPDIDDLRESPAKYIVQKVLESDNQGSYFLVEPNIKNHESYEITAYKDAVEIADIVVFLVAHKEFKNSSIENKIVLDFCGVTNTII